MPLPRDKAPVTSLDQARLDGLNCAANALLRVGTAAKDLSRVMADDIERTQRECTRRVCYRDGSIDRIWFTFHVSRGADYLRVTTPKEVRMLSAKVSGVTISANLHKPGKYHHENLDVARAFRRLAELVERAPFPLADKDGDLAVV
jgi:hypothetical protein